MSCKSRSHWDSSVRVNDKDRAQSFSVLSFTLSCRYGAAEPHMVASFLGGKSILLHLEI